MQSDSCCPNGSLPSLRPGDNVVITGSEFLIGDLPVYVSKGQGKEITSAVLVGYDIYGFHGGRIRSICDEIAAAGYLVILPDYFRGDCWTAEREAVESANKMNWLTRYTKLHHLYYMFTHLKLNDFDNI